MPDIVVPLSLNVPALPDNDIWFANAAAWSAYWAQAGLFTANIPAATINDYGVVKQGNTLAYSTTPLADTQTVSLQLDPLGNGVFETVYMPRAESFALLKERVEEMETNYKNLKAALEAAGIINNA